MRHYNALWILTLVSACGVQALDINKPTAARVTHGPENSFGSSAIILRSFKVNDEGKKVEFGGARCSGKNGLVAFSGVMTPASITVPTYLQAERFSNQGKPPPIKVKCRYEKKDVKFEIIPTSSASNVTTTSGGQYNAQTGTYINPSVTHLTGRLSSTLPWRYSSANVDF